MPKTVSIEAVFIIITLTFALSFNLGMLIVPLMSLMVGMP